VTRAASADDCANHLRYAILLFDAAPLRALAHGHDIRPLGLLCRHRRRFQLL
jgi:hypothetical protein